MSKTAMFLLSLLTIMPVRAQSAAGTYKQPEESGVIASIASTYVQTAFMGLRPRTWMDCARLLAEAQELQTDDMLIHPDWQLCAVTQVERWLFPLFSNTAVNNLTASIGLSYRPSARNF